MNRLFTIGIALVFICSTSKASELLAAATTNTETAKVELAPLPLKLPLIPSIESWYWPTEFGSPPTIAKPRPPFLAPRGVTNVALGKPVTSGANRAYRASDQSKARGEGPFMTAQAALQMITDGLKEALDEQEVTLPRALQWVQIDLSEQYPIYAILVWHSFQNYYVFHDVVVQASDDPDFKQNVHTLFNNDRNNSSGLGVGSDQEYVEIYEGKLIRCRRNQGAISTLLQQWQQHGCFQCLPRDRSLRPPKPARAVFPAE